MAWSAQYGAVGMVAAILAQKRRGVGTRDRLKTICAYFLHNLIMWDRAYEKALMELEMHKVLVVIMGDKNHKDLLRQSAGGLFLELATKRDAIASIIPLLLEAMVGMCKSGLETLEEPGVRGLAWLAAGPDCKEMLLERGAVEQLAAVVKRRGDNDTIREFSLRGMLNLSTHPKCQVRSRTVLSTS